MPAPGTRRRILDAALGAFVETGYERTTIAQIRQRSGVSNGALFHHFPSKDAIADALHVDAITSFQQGLWQLLRGTPRSLRAAVRGTIAHQFQWVEQHPDLARFVYGRGHLDWESPAGAEVAAMNRELAAAFKAWMAPLVDRGEVRLTSMLVITAVVSGPAHAVSRRWLAGQLELTPSALTDELTDAACAGLSGKPVKPGGQRHVVADRGRVTIELVDSHGAVVAQGVTTAELVQAQR